MKTLKDIKETKDIETFRFNDRDWILKYYSENSKKIENKQLTQTKSSNQNQQKNS